MKKKNKKEEDQWHLNSEPIGVRHKSKYGEHYEAGKHWCDLFSALQDSSIGDIVTQAVIQWVIFWFQSTAELS